MPSLPTPYYEQDGITIYHGDCRDILPLIEPGSVDLVLTDPPYGMNLDTNYSSLAGTTKWKAVKGDYAGKEYARVAGDDAPFEPALILSFGRPTILFGADHYSDKLPPSRGWIVWDKREELGSNMLSDAELAWTNIATPTRIYRHKWLGYMRASEVGKHLHPTQKPVTLMRWILGKWSNPSGLVLDPYMGSGPVARACADTGRRYIGIELEERYCEIAAKRLQQSVLPMFAEAAS